MSDDIINLDDIPTNMTPPQALSYEKLKVKVVKKIIEEDLDRLQRLNYAFALGLPDFDIYRARYKKFISDQAQKINRMEMDIANGAK